MSKNIAIIENPLTFMVENYLKKYAIKDEFSTTKIYMVLKNELPYKVFLTFDNDTLCAKFIEKYNQKSFEKLSRNKEEAKSLQKLEQLLKSKIDFKKLLPSSKS